MHWASIHPYLALVLKRISPSQRRTREREELEREDTHISDAKTSHVTNLKLVMALYRKYRQYHNSIICLAHIGEEQRLHASLIS